MLEMVLFIASKVLGGTSFWISVTSNGSISCIISERNDFLEEPAELEFDGEPRSSKDDDDDEETTKVRRFP